MYAREYGKHTYNRLYLPYTKKYIAERFAHVDSDGRRYQKRKRAGGIYEKQYLDESLGVPLATVWSDLKQLYSYHLVKRKLEELGFPTQKPQALLERIVKLSSNAAEIVLDPFCGCGTAIAAAQKLDRRWIGIDVSPTACKLMVQRMRLLGVAIQDREITGLPHTLEEVKAMQPFEFQNWVLQKLGGRASERKSVDGGIDGWLSDKPVQVKQSDAVGRDVIKKLETDMRRVKKNGAIVVAFSFARTTYEEVARAKNEESLSITLMTVEDLLSIP